MAIPYKALNPGRWYTPIGRIPLPLRTGIVYIDTAKQRRDAQHDRNVMHELALYLRQYHAGKRKPHYALPITYHLADTYVLANDGRFEDAAAWQTLVE